MKKIKRITLSLGKVAVASTFVITFQLLFFASASAALNPSISTTATQSAPLNTISISGSSFAPNETVRISLGLSTINVTANPSGSFNSANLTVPSIQTGTHIVTAVGLTSGAPAYTSLWISTFAPQVTPSTYYSFPGNTLTFSGTGFAQNEEITIASSGSTVETITANSSGSFTSDNVTIPYTASGSISYTITGETSGAESAATITIGGISPYLQADAYSGNPGDVIHIQGFNFAGNEDVTLTAGSFTVTTTANGSGTTPVLAVTLPFTPNSLLEIKLKGEETHMSTTLNAWIGGSSAGVSPSTYYTQPGTSVTFTGTSFAPNETVKIKLNNSNNGSVVANASGSFTHTLTIPLSATSGHFTFRGDDSNQSASVDITLAQFYSGITLSTYWAQGGTPLTINGGGFGSGEEIAFSTPRGEFGTITADSTGSFVWNGSVPFGPSGEVTLTARGSETNAVSTSPFTIAPVWTGVSLNNYAGTPGTSLTLTGTGYLANEPISITSSATGDTVIGTVNADGSGNVNGNFTIPSVSAGNLTLTFTGTNSFDKKEITIYVQSQP